MPWDCVVCTETTHLVAISLLTCGSKHVCTEVSLRRVILRRESSALQWFGLRFSVHRSAAGFGGTRKDLLSWTHDPSDHPGLKFWTSGIVLPSPRRMMSFPFRFLLLARPWLRREGLATRVGQTDLLRPCHLPCHLVRLFVKSLVEVEAASRLLSCTEPIRRT